MIGQYKIEQNIPIPPVKSTSSFDVVDKMKVGDSILFPAIEWKRARNQCFCRKPKQFTFRKEPNGYRCWRIK